MEGSSPAALTWECRNCRMKFPTKAKLETHITKFCDSAALLAANKQQQPGMSPARPAAGATATTAAAAPASLLSFDEVRQYFKDSDGTADQQPGADGGGGGGRIGGGSEFAGLPLGDVRRQFQAGEADRENMQGSVLKKLEQERADELNQLKIKYNAAQARKAEEHSELARRMREVESLRQRELNARLEKQRAAQVLDGLDGNKLDNLEQQKRKQIAHLLNDRESLQRKEKLLADQLAKLETDLIREKEQRKREAATAALAAAANRAGLAGGAGGAAAAAAAAADGDSVTAAGVKVVRSNAQNFGERAAELRLKKDDLKRQRDVVLQSLDEKSKKLAESGIDPESIPDGAADGDADIWIEKIRASQQQQAAAGDKGGAAGGAAAEKLRALKQSVAAEQSAAKGVLENADKDVAQFDAPPSRSGTGRKRQSAAAAAAAAAAAKTDSDANSGAPEYKAGRRPRSRAGGDVKDASAASASAAASTTTGATGATPVSPAFGSGGGLNAAAMAGLNPYQQQLLMQQQLNGFGTPAAGLGAGGAFGLGGGGGFGGPTDSLHLLLQQQQLQQSAASNAAAPMLLQYQLAMAAAKQENAKLASALEELARAKERDQNRYAMEHALEGFQKQLAQVVSANAAAQREQNAQHRKEIAENSPNPYPAFMVGGGYRDETTIALARLAQLPPSSELYKLEMEHLVRLSRLRHEKELLDRKNEIERARDELERRQRGEMRTPPERMRFAQIGKQVATPKPPPLNNGGFYLLWDFCVGFDSPFEWARIVYQVMDGGIPKTKAATTVQLPFASDAHALKRLMIRSKKLIPPGIVAGAGVKVVVQVQICTDPAIDPSADDGGPQGAEVRTVAWTVFDLYSTKAGVFDEDGVLGDGTDGTDDLLVVAGGSTAKGGKEQPNPFVLRAGWWRLPLYLPPVSLSASPATIGRTNTIRSNNTQPIPDPTAANGMVAPAPTLGTLPANSAPPAAACYLCMRVFNTVDGRLQEAGGDPSLTLQTYTPLFYGSSAPKVVAPPPPPPPKPATPEPAPKPRRRHVVPDTPKTAKPVPAPAPAPAPAPVVVAAPKPAPPPVVKPPPAKVPELPEDEYDEVEGFGLLLVRSELQPPAPGVTVTPQAEYSRVQASLYTVKGSETVKDVENMKWARSLENEELVWDSSYAQHDVMDGGAPGTTEWDQRTCFRNVPFVAPPTGPNQPISKLIFRCFESPVLPLAKPIAAAADAKDEKKKRGGKVMKEDLEEDEALKPKLAGWAVVNVFGRLVAGKYDAFWPNFGEHHLQWYKPPVNYAWIFKDHINIGPRVAAPKMDAKKDMKSATGTGTPGSSVAVNGIMPPRPVFGWWLTVRLYDPTLGIPPLRNPPIPLTHDERRAREGKEIPFIPCGQGPFNEQVYEAGDYYDIYVDRGRFFPSNVTISKVALEVYTVDATRVGPDYWELADIRASPYSPHYEMRAEARIAAMDNPTATAVMRVLAFDKLTNSLKMVGVTCINLFTKKHSYAQPTDPNEHEYALNVGCFQLPLYSTIPKIKDKVNMYMFKDAKKVPCATILMRIMQAPRSPDGLHVLSIDAVDEADVERLKAPLPPYSEGKFENTRAMPSPIEQKLYHILAARPATTLKEVIPKLPGGADVDLSGDEVLDDWYKEKCGVFASKRIDEYGLLDPAFEYSSDLGFRVSVDGANGFDEKALTVAFFSLSPPADFYPSNPDDRLSQDVKMTKWNFDAPLKAPRYQNDLQLFKAIPYDMSMCLVIDIRQILPSAKDLKEVELKPIGWTLLPIFEQPVDDDQKEAHAKTTMERIDTGSYQLPLYAGEVRRDILLAIKDNVANNGCASLERACEGKLEGLKAGAPPLRRIEWASVFVRLVDEQRSSLMVEPMGEVNPSSPAAPSITPPLNLKHIPKNRIGKYAYDKKEVLSKGFLGFGSGPKLASALIPANSSADQFTASQFPKVAKAAGVDHLTRDLP